VKPGLVEENSEFLGLSFWGRFMGQFQIRAKIGVGEKMNKHSNRAQTSGAFMGQKWRIYGFSDNIY
jgi:hypothetical protein